MKVDRGPLLACVALLVGCAATPESTKPAPEPATDERPAPETASSAPERDTTVPPAPPPRSAPTPAPRSAPAPGREAWTAETLEIFGAEVVYPPPVWASDPAAASRSRVNRQRSGPRFVLEQLPGDESPERWKRLFSVYVHYRRDSRFEAFKEHAVLRWVRTCGRANIGFQALVDEPLRWMAIVVCERSPVGSPESGWGEGVGAITLLSTQRLADTYVRVHHTWRGPALSRGDTASWPVSDAELAEMVRRFTQIRVLAADGAG